MFSAIKYLHQKLSTITFSLHRKLTRTSWLLESINDVRKSSKFKKLCSLFVKIDEKMCF